jgi:hypothetical protein
MALSESSDRAMGEQAAQQIFEQYGKQVRRAFAVAICSSS